MGVLRPPRRTGAPRAGSSLGGHEGRIPPPLRDTPRIGEGRPPGARRFASGLVIELPWAA